MPENRLNRFFEHPHNFGVWNDEQNQFERIYNDGVENCTNSMTVQPGTQPGPAIDDATLKLGIMLAALLLLLKVKA